MWRKCYPDVNELKLKLSLSPNAHKFKTIMKKYIEINDEVLESVLARLAEGKCVKGSLHRDKWTGAIVFTFYNLKPCAEKQEVIIGRTDFGRVIETPRRYKIFESLPKHLGLTRLQAALDRDISDAKTTIVTNEIIDRV